MLEKRFIPRQAIEQKRAWIERSSERAGLSPDAAQERLDTLDVAAMIFNHTSPRRDRLVPQRVPINEGKRGL